MPKYSFKKHLKDTQTRFSESYANELLSEQELFGNGDEMNREPAVDKKTRGEEEAENIIVVDSLDLTKQ